MTTLHAQDALYRENVGQATDIKTVQDNLKTASYMAIDVCTCST